MLERGEEATSGKESQDAAVFMHSEPHDAADQSSVVIEVLRPEQGLNMEMK